MGLSPLASLFAAGALAVFGILTAGGAPAASSPIHGVEGVSIHVITTSSGFPAQQRFLGAPAGLDQAGRRGPM